MIPVCAPFLSEKELEYVTDCIKTNWISSKGKYIEEFEEKFARFCGAEYGIATTSGTTALHLALKSLNLGKQDEVIIPASTMIATAFSVIYTGAKPVLVDSEPETYNINPAKIEKKITKNTKAIIPVHIFGHPCNMDEIMNIAEGYDLFVIEDAAESHGAEYKKQKVGGFGDAGCFSFYANKIVTTGEGGMVITNNKNIAQKARLLKDLAFSKEKRFLHDDLGFNYRMSNILAAIGVAQMEKIDEFIERRRKNAQLYNSLLKDVEGIITPTEKSWAKNVYWMYSILIERGFGITRDELIKKLEKEGIETRTFFLPMHYQPVFKKMGLFEGQSYPVAEEISRTGMYLPSGSGLKKEEIAQICEVIKDISRCEKN